MKENKHHIWCNRFMGPAEGCKMCERLKERYPEIEGDRLGSAPMRKYFPGNYREGNG